MSATISSIKGERITDSRGNPTISVSVTASDGSTGIFSVPAGASTGIHEAHELRDGGTGDVTGALALIANEIAPALLGMDVSAQEYIDRKMIALDGTPNKERLGGNTMIGISVACAKAAAHSAGKEVWQYLHDAHFADKESAFPLLYANLINGGKHAQTALAFQEYHVVPKTRNMKEASSLVARIQEELGRMIKERYGSAPIGDEGGYALPESNVETPLLLLEEASRAAGALEEVSFALDVAASSFFDKEKNAYEIAGTSYGNAELTALYDRLVIRFGLLSIEDPYQEEAFEAFAQLRGNTTSLFLRVGDDLTTTNKERLSRAIQEKSIDAIIIKPNQIGTLTETIETMKSAEENGIKCIVSHRSGETSDDFIADLAYASAAFGLKLGARGPSKREAKYSRLLSIEESIPHHEN